MNLFWKTRVNGIINDTVGNTKRQKIKYLVEYLNGLLVEEKDNKDEQDDVFDKIMFIYTFFRDDFRNNPWGDKISTTKEGSSNNFHYKFENGHKLTLEWRENTIHYSDGVYKYTYKLGTIYWNMFADVANSTIENQKERHSNNPKWQLYQTLLETIKSREEQLATMKNVDTSTLVNELDAARRRAAEMKEKYKF